MVSADTTVTPGPAGSRVPAVTPRTLIAALAVVVAAVASSCTTFTDSSNVARVGDETLSEEELREIVSAITGTPIGDTVDGENGINFVGNANSARTGIEFWITGQLARTELDAVEIEIPQSTIDDTQARLAGVVPNFGELSADARDTIIDLEATIVVFTNLPNSADVFTAAVDQADIYVDPRYGTFQLPGGVQPLT